MCPEHGKSSCFSDSTWHLDLRHSLHSLVCPHVRRAVRLDLDSREHREHNLHRQLHLGAVKVHFSQIVFLGSIRPRVDVLAASSKKLESEVQDLFDELGEDRFEDVTPIALWAIG